MGLIVAFSFPSPEPWSTNQDRNLHHMERAKLISAWKQATMLSYRSHMARLKVGYALPPGIVQVTIPFKDRRRRDLHNYCGTVGKAVIDGMVAAGAWPDDTPEFVGHREPKAGEGKQVLVEVWDAAV